MVVKYLLAACAGAAAGYYVAQKRLSHNYQTLLAAETEEVRDHYQYEARNNRQKYEEKIEEMQRAVVAPTEAVAEYRMGPSILQQEKIQAASEAFDSASVDLNSVDATTSTKKPRELEEDRATEVDELTQVLEEDSQETEAEEKPEIKVRGLGKVTPSDKVNYNALSAPEKAEESKPVMETAPGPAVDVIEKTAFMEDQFHYPQFSLTYYSADDVLSGQSDQVIPQQSRQKYLGGSILEQIRDSAQDTVWLRNHAEKVELEIERSPGSYTDEVQPLEDANRPRPGDSLEDIMG